MKIVAGILVGVVALAVAAYLVLIVIWGAPSPRPADSTGAMADCQARNNLVAAQPLAKPLRRPLRLTPAEGSAQRIVNLDADRDAEALDAIRLNASRPFPSRLAARHLELYADPLVRTGDDASETVSLRGARFNEPTFKTARRRVQFTLCLNPAGLPAGRYTGLVNVDGPRQLNGATVAVTVNAKETRWFWRGMVIALLAAAATLLFRGAAEKRLEHRKAPTDADPNPPWPSWWTGMTAALKDGPFWFTSVVALGTAFAALYSAYASDPAWGASGLTSVLALIVTAFAAVGGQTLLAGLRQGTGAK